MISPVIVGVGEGTDVDVEEVLLDEDKDDVVEYAELDLEDDKIEDDFELDEPAIKVEDFDDEDEVGTGLVVDDLELVTDVDNLVVEDNVDDVLDVVVVTYTACVL